MITITDERRTNGVVWALLGSVFVVFCTSFYAHLYAEAFEFLVEAPCDAAIVRRRNVRRMDYRRTARSPCRHMILRGALTIPASTSAVQEPYVRK